MPPPLQLTLHSGSCFFIPSIEINIHGDGIRVEQVFVKGNNIIIFQYKFCIFFDYRSDCCVGERGGGVRIYARVVVVVDVVVVAVTVVVVVVIVAREEPQ